MQTKQIVNTLMLDDATAAKFTPVYEKYLKELRECRMMTHKARTEKTKGQGTDAKKERPSMTDDEIATMLRNQLLKAVKCWMFVKSITMNSARYFRRSRF